MMKRIFTTFLLLASVAAFANEKTFRRLAEVNSCWKEQGRSVIANLPDYDGGSETEWIQIHLSLVEQVLRNKSTANLSASQKAHRAEALKHLNEYWHRAAFPQNEDYATRLPIFIDKLDNFCAVGYLVKATGHEDISRKISANTNLAYVREMNYPELNQWAADYGFTTDELAWIQPGYAPVHHGKALGKGVNGIVHEMFADDAEGKLYVGGAFTMADSSLATNNIAYVTEANGIHTWHTMGAGFNGPVYAIAKHNNKIFAAGAFTMSGDSAVNNVAYWDGSQWRGAGCIFGAVKDLLVHNGELFACGDFDVCAALSEVNFARWQDDLYWQQIPGLEGVVNTMESTDTSIILGGLFSFVDADAAALNIVSWKSDSTWFQTYDLATTNEVMDFEWFADTLYAACRQTGTDDSALLLCLRNKSWTNSSFNFISSPFIKSFNTLCAQEDTLHIGGDFHYPMMMLFNANMISVMNGAFATDQFIITDSTINKQVYFKGNLYVGGAFTKENSWSNNVLNGIAMRTNEPMSVGEVPASNTTLNIYPNPASSSITINAGFAPAHFTLHDMSGRVVYKETLGTKKATLALPKLSAGIYTAEVRSENGTKAVEKLVIE